MSSPLKQNTATIQELLNTINELPNAGGSDPVLQDKTITPTTSSQTVTADFGYDGLDTVTVAGDSDLVAGNIKSGVNIFGVTGTYAGSGGDTSLEDSLVIRNITSYTNDRVASIGSHAFNRCTSLATVSFPKVTSIGSYAFYYCTSLTSVSFPKVTSIGSYAFYYCTSLTSVSFPKVTSIGSYAFGSCSSLTSVSFPVATTIDNRAFYYCTSLTSVSFPKVTSIGSYAFGDCTSLTSVSFPVATTIGSSAFAYCYNLKSLYLTGSSLCKLSNSNAFYSTPIGGYSTSAGTYGSIYVPASLLASYKAATNWTYFSSRFVGIGDTGGIISFTIVGTSYQAEDGMTWGEWVESEYNICEAQVVSSGGNMYIVIERSDRVVDGESGEFIVPTDKIIKNYSYQIV